MDQAKYFAGIMNDSLRKRVNSILSISSNKGNFIFSADTARIYDGFIYGIEYRNRDSIGSFILFVPSSSPLGIQFVESVLDSLVANAVPNLIDSFAIGPFKTKLEDKVIATGIKMPKVVPPKVEFKNSK
jgi:hypothetical protein